MYKVLVSVDLLPAWQLYKERWNEDTLTHVHTSMTVGLWWVMTVWLWWVITVYRLLKIFWIWKQSRWHFYIESQKGIITLNDPPNLVLIALISSRVFLVVVMMSCHGSHDLTHFRPNCCGGIHCCTSHGWEHISCCLGDGQPIRIITQLKGSTIMMWNIYHL